MNKKLFSIILFMFSIMLLAQSVLGASNISITVIYPGNITYTNNDILFDILTNSTPDTCLWTNDSWVTNTSMTVFPTNNRSTSTIIDYKEGHATVNFWCNNTLGIANYSANVSFTVDSMEPIITISVPANTTYTTTSLDFLITTNEQVDTCLISRDNFTTNATMTLSADNLTANYTNSTITDGAKYSMNFWCNDTAGNAATSDIVKFTINTKHNKDVTTAAGCRQLKAILYAAFGLIALFAIISAGYFLIQMFNNGADLATGIALTIGIIGLGVVIMVGILVLTQIGSSVCF